MRAKEGGAIPEFVVRSKLIQQQVMPSSSSANSKNGQAAAAQAGAGLRVCLGMLALIGVTVGGLCFAWWHPQDTLWHFFVVTQLIPLFYLGLAWWTAADTSGDA